jgi:hypothetical protein
MWYSVNRMARFAVVLYILASASFVVKADMVRRDHAAAVDEAYKQADIMLRLEALKGNVNCRPE